MNFPEAAAGSCSQKFRKILQQESCRPAILLKGHSRCFPLNIAKFLRTPILNKHLLTAASDFLKQPQNTGEQLLLY